MTADDVAYTFQLLQGQAGAEHQRDPVRRHHRGGQPVTLTFDKLAVRQPEQDPQTRRSCRSTVVHDQGPGHRPVKNPVGTGPYTLKTFTPQTVTLAARDGYWQDTPKVKELRYTSYTDNNAQATALANGAVRVELRVHPELQGGLHQQGPAALQAVVPAGARRARPVVQHRESAVQRPGAAPGDEHGDQPRGRLQPGRGRLLLPEDRPRSPASRPRRATRSSPPQYKGKNVKVDVPGAKAC